MKNLLVFVLFLLIGCTTPTWINVSNTSSNLEINYSLTKSQFDSLCYADTLPINLDLWLVLPLRDYEDKNIIERYMYIKQLEPYHYIYILEIENGIYLINKRL